ncbi:MAG: hypothetical protein JRI25_14400 [Deltaproteobacteria bacterium]|nr:hypothetical protein [Deltaproteobacteria bacterium]MBW2255775.1 hypothetical protein [Deltaproteobacteria bacterium]
MAERWDIAIRVLDGPIAGTEQVLRGPVVHVGAAPGPGGFGLSGYRGLDARHLVLTSYQNGQATVAPVGTNQVRMGPHPNVDWNTIEPIGGPQYLSDGCALHLGAVGRGATLEFLGLRELGVRAGGDLSSSRAGVHGATRIRSSSAPMWFVGCLLLMAVVASAAILAVVIFQPPEIEPLGPTEEGEPFYRFAEVSREQVDERLREGLRQPFTDFVMSPNIDTSGRKRLTDPENWDQTFYEMVAASVQTHLKARSVFRRLDVVREEYATVVEAMREAGLPEVFAAIPYLESRYDGSAQSRACAKGYWQFMPEVPNRVERDADLVFQVRDCSFRDAPGTLWTPEGLVPVAKVMLNAIYVDREVDPPRCRIDSCRVDHRTDLEKSTEAAAFTLGEAWADPDLRASGALVQITIASHNAGYDDSRFGVPKPANLRPAYLRWAKGRPGRELPDFYGANLTTPTPDQQGWNGSLLPPETQHYVYTAIAEHFLAVCYYGLNYADQIPAFRTYAGYTDADGYCTKLAVPTTEVLTGPR